MKARPPAKREALLARMQTMPGGAAMDELAPVMGLDTDSKLSAVRALFRELEARGQVVWVHEPKLPKAQQRLRFFAIQYAPKVHGEASMHRKVIKPKPKTMTAAAGPAIIPEGLTAKDCGGFTGRHRHTVDALPDGYVSQLTPAECRPWAMAVAA